MKKKALNISGTQVAQEKEGEDEARSLKKDHNFIRAMCYILCRFVFELKNLKQGNNMLRFTF